MFCPNCGKEMNDVAQFCTNCGWSKTGAMPGANVEGSKKSSFPTKPIIAVVALIAVGFLLKNVFLGGGAIGVSGNLNTAIDQMETVKFGSYYQSNLTSKEPIEWIVLEKQGNKTLLLSKYILDCKCYNNEYKDVTWETCTLRNWLNNDFYNQAFTSNEQNRIQITNVINNNNSEYGIKGGNITNDRIFCLSIEEIEKYFYQPDMQSDNKRVATRGTNYAKNVDNLGSKLWVSYNNDWYGGNSYFWLRSPGGRQNYAARVYDDGYLGTLGYCVGVPDNGVRPALWISN